MLRAWLVLGVLSGCVTEEVDVATSESELDLAPPGGGQVGLPRPRPAKVAAIDNATCVVYTDGTMRCAGSFPGPNGLMQFSTPTSMQHVAGAIAGTYRAYLRGGGALSSVASTVATPPTHIATGAVATDGALDHACGLLADGRVTCWGANGSGQLGIDGAPPVSTGVVIVPDLPSVVEIAVDNRETWVLSQDDRVFQLIGSQRVEVLAGVSTFDAAAHHVCALRNAGSVVCTGNNGLGQLGASSQSATLGLVAEPTAIDVAVGDGFSCALRSTGVVRCWGANFHGHLGNGTTSWSTYLPTTVILPRPATQIAASGEHGCALLDDRSVYCWGGNYNGELGLGINSIVVPTPQRTLF
jgi:alpha-tubulin suppressor-like RCC1 family protein